jgi:hypothetical protein
VARSKLTIDKLLGIDYTSNTANVSVSQSPNAQNMIRSEPGKVRKRMGYKLRAAFPARVNGFHELKGKSLIHAGTALYELQEDGKEVGNALYSDMADARSKSWQMDDKLFIADGKRLLVYDGETVKKASDDAKIPTLTIAKPPQGGGKEYEALNLLQPKFKELFASDGKSTEYHLSFSGLDSADVTVRKLNSSGDWENVTSGFSCNKATGVVTFSTAPGKSPVEGEDNIEITATRTVEGYADRINKCCIGILFGVNGAADRLFLSGNPDYPNQDWYSGQYDLTYWPDTGYSKLGSEKSAVMGYSIIENRIAAHKDENETDRNVVIRQGNLVDNEPAFPITNTIQGPGAIAKYSFAYCANEPLFLTNLGVYAITPSDIVGERFSQNRSYYMNGKLLEETNKSEAYACVYKDMYWLCLNGVAYILDGQQNLGTNAGEPYSTRQYACFYETNIPARIMWVEGTDLYFGADSGNVYRFYTDPDDMASYNDDGEAIAAEWETPDLSGNLVYKNKSFRYLALQMAPSAITSIAVYAMKRGIWNKIWQDETHARYFSYHQLRYSRFTYSNDQTARTLHNKIRIKRVDKARFRFVNDALNEPFGLMQIAVEFVENGNFKG